jgi:thioredoxin
MLSVTYENFDDAVLESKRLVVVDFWAEWCGPCKVLTPLIEKVSTDYDMDFVKINVDDCHELAEAFNIKSIPTLLIFNNSEPLAQVSGLMTETDLRLQLDYAIALTDDYEGTSDSRIP